MIARHVIRTVRAARRAGSVVRIDVDQVDRSGKALGFAVGSYNRQVVLRVIRSLVTDRERDLIDLT